MEEHLEKVGIELKPGAIEILTYLKKKAFTEQFPQRMI